MSISKHPPHKIKLDPTVSYLFTLVRDVLECWALWENFCVQSITQFCDINVTISKTRRKGKVKHLFSCHEMSSKTSLRVRRLLMIGQCWSNDVFFKVSLWLIIQIIIKNLYTPNKLLSYRCLVFFSHHQRYLTSS